VLHNIEKIVPDNEEIDMKLSLICNKGDSNGKQGNGAKANDSVHSGCDKLNALRKMAGIGGQ